MKTLLCAALLLSAVAACKKEAPPGRESITPFQPSRGMAAAAAAGAGGSLAGKISIKDELKGKVAAGDTLFIIARKNPSGPPLAVAKVQPQTFPMAYVLTQANVMMPGMPFEGQVEVTVRIDKDGDAMTKNSGDLFGKSVKPVDIGDTGADVTIDQVIP